MEQKTIVRELPKEGFVRVNQFTTNEKTDRKTGEIVRTIGALPMSRSTFLKGVKAGIYPKPSHKFGARCTCWDVSVIRDIMARSS